MAVGQLWLGFLDQLLQRTWVRVVLYGLASVRLHVQALVLLLLTSCDAEEST